ncbi:hypothetical protein BDV96DRAFT_498421, partial [Lophiotrema nucula]
TYTVLGATGNCGTALIRLLLSEPHARIHAFCRNKSKLLQLVSDVQYNKKFEIFEAGIYDNHVLVFCINKCGAVFLVILTNDNIPGCRLGQDTAIAVIDALQTLKQSPKELLHAQEDWLAALYFKPGALVLDEQRGHSLSFTDKGSPLSYPDLAAAMLEVADDHTGLYERRNVSVANTNGRARFPRGTPSCIFMGLLRHFFPYLHPYLPATGPS